MIKRTIELNVNPKKAADFYLTIYENTLKNDRLLSDDLSQFLDSLEIDLELIKNQLNYQPFTDTNNFNSFNNIYDSLSNYKGFKENSGDFLTSSKELFPFHEQNLFLWLIIVLNHFRESCYDKEKSIETKLLLTSILQETFTSLKIEDEHIKKKLWNFFFYILEELSILYFKKIEGKYDKVRYTDNLGRFIHNNYVTILPDVTQNSLMVLTGLILAELKLVMTKDEYNKSYEGKYTDYLIQRIKNIKNR